MENKRKLTPEEIEVLCRSFWQTERAKYRIKEAREKGFKVPYTLVDLDKKTNEKN